MSLSSSSVSQEEGQARLVPGAGWRWATASVSIALGLFGIALLVGGVWLIALGGSWYYGLAGAGSLCTAVLLWRQRQGALYLFAVIWGLTVVWALWEVGLNWWGLVPRLVAMTVILILILLLSPALRRVRHDAQ